MRHYRLEELVENVISEKMGERSNLKSIRDEIDMTEKSIQNLDDTLRAALVPSLLFDKKKEKGRGNREHGSWRGGGPVEGWSW